MSGGFPIIGREMSDETSQAIESVLGAAVTSSSSVGGGCIHDARRIELADGRRLFLKSASGSRAALLEAEARSLRLLAPHIRVPSVAGEGETPSGHRWLALEWLDLHPASGHEARGNLGRSLARLHQARAEQHGLDHDNFIGATPQRNEPMDEWHAFFVERRLRPQMDMVARSGHRLPEDRIIEAARGLLDCHRPPPSLLHGDLWSGNVAVLADGTPVVFDPAAYFGDPETDLAMLELFGAPLGGDFFNGYGPEPTGRNLRRPLYDLYHALNHVNLFGGGYLGMVRGCLDGLGIR